MGPKRISYSTCLKLKIIKYTKKQVYREAESKFGTPTIETTIRDWLKINCCLKKKKKKMANNIKKKLMNEIRNREDKK